MHELGLMQEIVAIVAERVPGRRVKRLVLEVGKLSAVLPDALRFCFDLAVAGTELEGAVFEIREIPGLARCRHCRAEMTLNQPFGVCACGHSDLEWLAGEELTIKELELS